MAEISAAKGIPLLGDRLRNLTLGHFLMAGVLVLSCFIILYPLLTLIHGSFQKADAWGTPTGYTLSNYMGLLEPDLLRSLRNTLVISLGTCLVAAFFGVTLAWITARTNSFAAGALEPFNLIPFYLSPLIGAIAWTFLASPSVGLLNRLVRDVLGMPGLVLNIYSIPGIIWVMGLFYTPYMYLFTVGSLRKMDPALEEASRTSGSGVLGTTLRVTIPLTLPGILFGLSLTFVTSMGLFSVPATLGMPYKIEVFATSIFNFVERDSPDFNMAATLGMVVITVTILTYFIQRKILLPREFTTVTGKGFRPHVIDLGRWGYLTFSFQMLYLAAAVGLPIGALLIVSVSQTWLGFPDLSRLTWDHFHYVLFRYPLTQRGIWNSIFLATVGASAGMAVCFVLAYCIHRAQGKGKAVLDFVVSLPIGMPAVVLSMGILLAYVRTPLYKTVWIILLAYITRYIPVGVKNVSSVLMAISQELEDSSRMCGAAWLTTVRRIFMPLLKPGLLAGWLTLFLIFMRELNASILLYTDGTEVMSVILYLLLQDAVAPQIAAYAVIQTSMTLGIVWLIRRFVAAEEVG